MARRPSANIIPERPVHSAEEKLQDIVRLRRRISELEAFDPNLATKRFSDPRVTSLETAIASTLATVFGERTAEYYRYSSATTLDHGAIVMSGFDRGGHVEVEQARRYLTEGKAASLALLQQAVKALEEEVEFAPGVSHQLGAVKPMVSPVASRKVFVVHGHDDAAKQGLARFLEQIGLEAVILHEQPNRGRTIIEKFEECADQVGFAVVLLTPDDLGAAKVDTNQNARVRQNVVFELGYFVGKLGRGKTCLLRKGDVEMPSDLFGVIYTDLDLHDGWKMKLVKEMKGAGFVIDANKV
jgi:predicted nucleotide-binding protein